MQALRILSLILVSLVVSVSTARATPLSTQDKAKQVWQLLDYLAVDYGGAIKYGRVANEAEYAEMQEFAQTIERQLAELPTTPTSHQLSKEAAALRASIAAKTSPETVAEQARKLAGGVLAAYPVPMAPSEVPDLQKGAKLYQSQCASCHGVSGQADGPLAARLNPPPIALADHARAQERSVFALQQIITRGVEGTSMPGFAQLTDEDRWALAYFASTLSYTDADRQAGAKLWASQSDLHAAIPTLAKLGQTSETALAKEVGASSAREVLAYLRSSPEVLAASNTDSLAIARNKLAESVTALDNGDTQAASQLALSAYLDGFEPVEPALAAKNQPLFQDIEKMMGLYRNAVTAGQVERAHDIALQLQSKLDDAQKALAGSTDAISTFLGALTILLREGLEALLVVVAMMAFLKKADRTDVLPYVHAGWVAALAAGALTWGVATYVVDLSGASREMTEGFSAVFAAIVLLGVGMWMHQKSLAGRWQAYVKEKLSSALNKKSALMLFLLAFVTVYREVFETVLFYAALWSDGNGIYMLAGLGLGIVILAAIAIVLLRSTARLPIRQFFAFSSALVGVLAVVLIGKGVAALQKVGLLQVTPVSMPRIDVLGVYPSLQTIAAQILILLIILASIAYNYRSQKQAVQA
ncbi:FTR1 family protein [Cupriavidus necator]